MSCGSVALTIKPVNVESKSQDRPPSPPTHRSHLDMLQKYITLQPLLYTGHMVYKINKSYCQNYVGEVL